VSGIAVLNTMFAIVGLNTVLAVMFATLCCGIYPKHCVAGFVGEHDAWHTAFQDVLQLLSFSQAVAIMARLPSPSMITAALADLFGWNLWCGRRHRSVQEMLVQRAGSGDIHLRGCVTWVILGYTYFWRFLMKTINLAAWLAIVSAAAAQADTFDLDCLIKGKPAIGIVDTNLAEQKVFGEPASGIQLSEQRLVMTLGREQLVVDRSNNTVFVDGEMMPDATCEIRNFVVAAATPGTSAAAAPGPAAVPADAVIIALTERLDRLEEENHALRDQIEGLADALMYLTDRQDATYSNLFDKLEGIFE